MLLFFFFYAYIYVYIWQGPGAVVEAACFENRRSLVEPRNSIQISNKQNVSSLLTPKDIVGNLRDREVASSASDLQG